MRKRECIYETSRKLDERLLAMNYQWVQHGRSRSDLLNQLSTSRTIDRPISFRGESGENMLSQQNYDENQWQEVIVSNESSQMKLIIRGSQSSQMKFQQQHGLLIDDYNNIVSRRSRIKVNPMNRQESTDRTESGEPRQADQFRVTFGQHQLLESKLHGGQFIPPNFKLDSIVNSNHDGNRNQHPGDNKDYMIITNQSKSPRAGLMTLHENTLQSIKKHTDPEETPDLMKEQPDDEPTTAFLINQTFNNSMMHSSKKKEEEQLGSM
jgi:secreted PhoX family phosphatase